jgi:hypothetical protein
MKIKKIPRYFALSVLTAGASLILGLLSFGGMFVLWPALPVALAAFVLSVAYEGEVYLQNIKGAWNKLFKKDHLKQQLVKDYLNIPRDHTTENYPLFFKDYEAQRKLVHQLSHKRLDKESLAQKKQAEKTLRNMERWFIALLFSKDHKEGALTPYESELRSWMAIHHQKEQQEKNTLLASRQKTFLWAKGFSAIAGVFMSLGTSYLLVEAFSAIPWFTAISFASWPFFIVPMALIAGTAYGLLTYNAITDMISNDTLRQGYQKLRNSLSQGLTVRNVLMAATTLFLLILAVALTICTAGTWWTVVKETRPLFAWMSKIPSVVMGVIHPIVTGLSSLVFITQNTSESLDMIDKASQAKSGFFSQAFAALKKGFQTMRAQENGWQQINPFRLLLKITIMPLRILLFLGHLISIGVTANRVPGVSKILSAILGIISEGFEDAHYFIGHAEEDPSTDPTALPQGESHEHHHENDLPTRMIRFIATPLYFLAALWDYLSSQYNKSERPVLSFHQAWEKQRGVPREESIDVQNTAPTSAHWQNEWSLYDKKNHPSKDEGLALSSSSNVNLVSQPLQGYPSSYFFSEPSLQTHHHSIEQDKRVNHC